ncbi:MAG TPA: MarR family transcriptional regulator [Acidimicrobiia bacterium]|nr:MarR family transcriptional regulator [Acidimicrobiia bacterium]
MSGPEAEVPPPLIGALMRMPVDAVHRRIIADLHAAGFTDLVDAHMAVLRYPGPHGQRPSDLAAELGMSKQAVNYLLGALEQSGYVRRADDPDDKRSRRVELTDRGETVRRTIRATVADIESELAGELGDRAFERLRALLVRLNDTEFVRGSARGS